MKMATLKMVLIKKHRQGPYTTKPYDVKGHTRSDVKVKPYKVSHRSVPAHMVSEHRRTVKAKEGKTIKLTPREYRRVKVWQGGRT